MLLLVALLSLIIGCTQTETVSDDTTNAISAKPYDGKKIIYIDSYHEGYPWSDGITMGVQSTLEGTGVELKIHRMDTKRNPSDEFKKQAALGAKSVIEELQIEN